MTTRATKGKIEMCIHNFIGSIMPRAYNLAIEQTKVDKLEDTITAFNIEIKVTIIDNEGNETVRVETNSLIYEASN